MTDIEKIEEVTGGGLLSSNQKFKKWDWIIPIDERYSSDLYAYRITNIIKKGTYTKYEVTEYEYFDFLNRIISRYKWTYDEDLLIEGHQPSWWNRRIVK